MFRFIGDNVSEFTDNLISNESQLFDLEEIELKVLKEIDSFNVNKSKDFYFKIKEPPLVSPHFFLNFHSNKKFIFKG
jgi:hypothetical protein